jgi:four helix bundle protein
MRNFRQLEVWKQSVEFVTKVYEITKQFPPDEKYGLVSQMNRCAVSVPANIAEGGSRKTELDFARFLEIAIGSSFELETYFEITMNLSFINAKDYECQINELNIIQKRINALRESILKKGL